MLRSDGRQSAADTHVPSSGENASALLSQLGANCVYVCVTSVGVFLLCLC